MKYGVLFCINIVKSHHRCRTVASTDALRGSCYLSYELLPFSAAFVFPGVILSVYFVSVSVHTEAAEKAVYYNGGV